VSSKGIVTKWKITQKAKYIKLNRVVKNKQKKNHKTRNKWRTLEDIAIEENARSFPKRKF
jgi:hypothetical protein